MLHFTIFVKRTLAPSRDLFVLLFDVFTFIELCDAQLWLVTQDVSLPVRLAGMCYCPCTWLGCVTAVHLAGLCHSRVLGCFVSQVFLIPVMVGITCCCVRGAHSCLQNRRIYPRHEGPHIYRLNFGRLLRRDVEKNTTNAQKKSSALGILPLGKEKYIFFSKTFTVTNSSTIQR